MPAVLFHCRTIRQGCFIEDPNNQQQFAVSLKTDRDGFLRRRCPQCGRDFKTEINPADLQWELATQCRRMGVAVGDDSGDSEPAQLRCPYCAHVAPPSDMHTEETVDYLKRLINREIVIPQLNRFTSDLEDKFPGRGHSGGMFSISMELKGSRIAPATTDPRSGAARYDRDRLPMLRTEDQGSGDVARN